MAGEKNWQEITVLKTVSVHRFIRPGSGIFYPSGVIFRKLPSVETCLCLNPGSDYKQTGTRPVFSGQIGFDPD